MSQHSQIENYGITAQETECKLQLISGPLPTDLVWINITLFLSTKKIYIWWWAYCPDST